MCIAQNKNPQMHSCHLNKYCFSFCPNISIDCTWSRRSAGKLFQIFAQRLQSFASQVYSIRCSDGEATGHSRAEMSSAGYCRHRYTVSSQIWRRHSMQTLVDHHRQLVHDTLTDWKPVEFTQDRCLTKYCHKISTIAQITYNLLQFSHSRSRYEFKRGKVKLPNLSLSLRMWHWADNWGMENAAHVKQALLF